MPNHSVTCGYARVSKADDEARNLETKLPLLETHRVRPPGLLRRRHRPLSRTLRLAGTGGSDPARGPHRGGLPGPVQPQLRGRVRIQADLVDATSERIRGGQARGEGRRIGRTPALSPEQVEQCLRMAQEGAGHRRIARVMKCSLPQSRKLWPRSRNNASDFALVGQGG